MASGIYNLAADVPHFRPVQWILKTGSTRSIRFHSRGIPVPNLRDRLLIRHGFGLYRKNCQPCHGAPGVASEQMGRGINPKPPPLMTTVSDWDDSQLFWITTHGMKMSGMPSFAARLSDTDRWAVVAFLHQIAWQSPSDYEHLTAAADEGIGDESTSLSSDDDHGFAQLKVHGDPSAGRQLLRSYGCITCHTIPEIGWGPDIGSGSVGPPLTDFSERQYIAGLLVNVPANAVAWITDPHRFKPGTAMPNLNVQSTEAMHITAYLYKLGNAKRLNALEQMATRRR